MTAHSHTEKMIEHVSPICEHLLIDYLLFLSNIFLQMRKCKGRVFVKFFLQAKGSYSGPLALEISTLESCYSKSVHEPVSSLLSRLLEVQLLGPIQTSCVRNSRVRPSNLLHQALQVILLDSVC
jgi:hypothetical protein